MHDKTIRTLVQGLILSLLPAGAAFAGPVNLNSADAATLAKELDGIGPAKAQAIVEYRQKNGPFRSPEDLLKVDGIGERVLEQNRGNIRLNAARRAGPGRQGDTEGGPSRPRRQPIADGRSSRPGRNRPAPRCGKGAWRARCAIQYHAVSADGRRKQGCAA